MDVESMLLFPSEELPIALRPPATFQRYTLENLETEFLCPLCRFEWSGSPKPSERELKDALSDELP
jgi:hypothetical protein